MKFINILELFLIERGWDCFDQSIVTPCGGGSNLGAYKSKGSIYLEVEFLSWGDGVVWIMETRPISRIHSRIYCRGRGTFLASFWIFLKINLNNPSSFLILERFLSEFEMEMFND